MQTTKTRVIRWAGAAVAALTAGPLIGIAAAGAAGQPTDPNGSNNATTCAEIGLPNDTQINGANDGTVTQDGFTLTADGTTASYSSPTGYTVTAVVKGGDGYTVYSHGETVGLVAPLNGGENIPAISHWFICYHQTPTTPTYTAPTASAGADCTGLSAHLVPSDDPAGTTFHIVTSGGADDVTTTTPKDVSYAGGANKTITVSVGETTLATASSPASCGTHDPAVPSVTFADACTSGVTVSLDNPTAAPVTFTIDSTSGRANKITVPAGGKQSVSYPVVEDTTATVTVLADGLSTATHSYAKNCVQVQGVKVTKPTTAVLGEKVTRAPAAPATPATLPFTGTKFPVGWALALGVLLLAFGSLLVAAPDRLSAITGGRHRA